MPAKTWTLTDAAASTYVDQITIRPGDVGGSARGYVVAKRTLRGGLSDGVDVIRVDNGALAFEVLPTRGMNLWKAWLGGLEIGWRSPVRGPVHPQFVPLMEPAGLGWLDGFDELLMRCGLESNGPPVFNDQGKLIHPLHGRIGNRPAHRVSVAIDGEAGVIRVIGVVDEARFLFTQLRLTTTITTRVGRPGLEIRDVVENLSARPGEMQLLYHINFGLPLLDAGSRVRAPARSVVPRDAAAAAGSATWETYAAEQPGYAEQVFLMQLAGDAQGRTQVLLENSAGAQGVSLAFSTQQLPCFTLWKNTAAAVDGYVTGLEPATNFPNARPFEKEQGRVMEMPPGASFAFDLGLTVHDSPASLEKTRQEIAALAGGIAAKVYDQPQPGWSPT